jgi:hypothetical protein
MSDSLTTEAGNDAAKKRGSEKFNKTRQRKVRQSEIDEFRVWLAGLGFQSEPKIHINGVNHSTAVVTVDFGTPLVEPLKLNAEQTADLISHMRIATKSLYRDREVNVRVQNDSSTGIWWTSIG